MTGFAFSIIVDPGWFQTSDAGSLPGLWNENDRCAVPETQIPRIAQIYTDDTWIKMK